MQHSIIKKLTLTPSLSKKLHRLANPPKQLWYRGVDPNQLLTRPAVAIVGTRKMTPYGRRVTEQLATACARAGWVLISGNALGVDVTAQKAALDAGGIVIAVVPSGLDKIYPVTNGTVAQRIINSGGCAVSEYSAPHQPRPEEFLARNRIIAGLSDAVIVTEAAERSGSLNTASHAMSSSIPLYTVPGPITSLQSTGTNRLLREGGRAIVQFDDLLQDLGYEKQTEHPQIIPKDPAQRRLFDLIVRGARTTDELLVQSGLSYGVLLEQLSMLELEDYIAPDDLGNGWEVKR